MLQNEFRDQTRIVSLKSCMRWSADIRHSIRYGSEDSTEPGEQNQQQTALSTTAALMVELALYPPETLVRP